MPNETTLPSPAAPARWRMPAAIAAVVTLGFGPSLYDLLRFALRSELYSHIVLVPAISAYLIRTRRTTLAARFAPDLSFALIPAILGAVTLAGFWTAMGSGLKLAHEDRLALTTLSYLLLMLGVGGWYFGRETMRALAFPLGFLIFMVPMPIFMTDLVETLLQHGSAAVAFALLSLAGTPVFRQDLVFQLPGITLQVAPECSGIHSTLALLITSVLAGHFFLRGLGKRVLLTVAVLPLALLRNGVRIFTISELCVHVSPDMIHSYIHRQGGPIFFALSLVPFFLLLVWLRRLENRSQPKAP